MGALPLLAVMPTDQPSQAAAGGGDAPAAPLPSDEVIAERLVDIMLESDLNVRASASQGSTAQLGPRLAAAAAGRRLLLPGAVLACPPATGLAAHQPSA